MAVGEVKDESQLESVLDSSENIVVILDGAGKIIRISRGVKTVLGYDESDLAGANIMTMVPIDRRDWMSAISKRAKEDGAVPDIFIHWKTKDGRRLITKSTMRSVVNYQHEVVGMIIAEEAAPSRETSWVMTPDQAMQLLHASEIAIVVTDLSGNIISFSSGAEKLTGLSATQVVGSSIGRVFLDRSAISNITTKGLRDGKVEDFPTVITTADDKRLEVSVSLSVRRNPSGAAVGFSFMMFDISKRMEMEHELELRAERLRLVNSIATKIRSGKSLNDIYLAAREGISKIVKFDSMTIMIISAPDDTPRISSFEGDHPDWFGIEKAISTSDGALGKALTEKRPVLYIPQELGESLKKDIPPDQFAIGLAVPLFAGDRELGILNLTTSIEDAFGAMEMDLVTLIAGHIALAVEATRLFSALMENINIQTVLIETSTAVRSETNLENAYRTAASKAQELVSSTNVALYMLESGALTLVTCNFDIKDEFPAKLAKEDLSSASSYFFGNGKELITDVSGYEYASDLEKKNFISIAMTELVGRTGPMGLIYAARKKGETPFTPYEAELMNLFGNHLSPSLENAQLFEDTRKSEVMAREALESERRTQEALHFILDMFAHDSQNQIQGILGYLELIGRSDVPAEVQSYIEKAIRQVRAGSYLISGTAHVFRNIDMRKEKRSTNEIIRALEDALRRFSMVFSNVEIKSKMPALDEKESDVDVLLSELFFHLVRVMHRASAYPEIEIELSKADDDSKILIDFSIEKGSAGKNILKNLREEKQPEIGQTSTMQLDPFLVRLLGEIYDARINTVDKEDSEGNPETVCTIEFQLNSRPQ
ncbi:MAG: PAS domain S-box protein [Thermoplasmata archaeon]|nr:PAS domain S-box protein [Thermoplasmata archaeon]